MDCEVLVMNMFMHDFRNGRNGGDRKDGEQKHSPVGLIMVIAIMLLGSIGIAALPLLFFAGVGYIAYMANKEKTDKEGGASASETFKNKMQQFQQKLDSMDEAGTRPTVKNVFADFIGNGEASKVQADASKSARAHMDSKFKDARLRQSGDKKDGETFYSMLSRSEQTHFDSFSSDSHDEYAHRSNELKDLLNAGIIEMPEYKERMALLKEEFKR